MSTFHNKILPLSNKNIVKNSNFKLLTVYLLFLSGLFSSCNPQEQKMPETNAIAMKKYQEPHRPQFHFSPEEKWMNDPNGMVYYEGEYHLFYQYYPDSTVWGPMHWGHAISRDLVTWEHLPIALYPDSLGYIFSGSAVVDRKNTSGLGTGEKPPLIAIFTHHDPEGAKAGRNDFQYQSIAYSNDRGRTWAMYEGNPVIPNTDSVRDFRDPKVVWSEEFEKWLMIFAAGDHLKFYTSDNLKEWTYLSDWGAEYGDRQGVWECPEIFPMKVKETGEEKWVVLLSLNPGHPNGGSGTQYFIGDFDGTKFTVDSSFEADIQDGKGVWLDYGRDNYAGVTWSDIPAEDGRRIFLGWMSNWDYAQVVPTKKWRSAMTLPRRLSLRKTTEGYRLFNIPVQELQALRGEKKEIEETEFAGTFDLSEKYQASASGTELLLSFDLKQTTAKLFGIELSNAKGESYRVGYNTDTGQLFSDRTKAGPTDFSEKFAIKAHTVDYTPENGKLNLHLWFDKSSAEVFADGGKTALTDIYFPSEDFSVMKLFAEEGKISLQQGEIYNLKGIW